MAPARRLVRRQPLRERVRAMLNPMDFLLWLSEEIETREWDSKALGTRAGILSSIVFLLARANAGGASRDVDDVFGEEEVTGWIPFIVRPLPRCGRSARTNVAIFSGISYSLGSRRSIAWQRLLHHHEDAPLPTVRSQH